MREAEIERTPFGCKLPSDRAPGLDLPEDQTEDDDVRGVDGKPREEEFSSAEIGGAGGYETCDQDSERHEVPDHEEAEKHEGCLARLNETFAAEREQEIDRE